MHVHWHEGLFLQPHHLQVMQHELQREIRAVRALELEHPFGVLESDLSADDLADGRVYFKRLLAVMPNGEEIDFPHSASLPSLDIKAHLARTRGLDKLEILLAVPLWRENRANAFPTGEPADPRVKLLYLPHEGAELVDENTGENAQRIIRRKINARLVTREDDLSDLQVMPLLRIMRATGEDSGQPRIDADYAPPSLQLRASPLLRRRMDDLVAQINSSREQLRQKLARGGLGSEIKWLLTLKLSILNRVGGMLTALGPEGRVHPFAWHLLLRGLLEELLALQPEKGPYQSPPYDHLDPLVSFHDLDERIRAEIRVAPAIEPLRVTFAGQPGRFRATLTAEHFAKPNAYFLGVRTRVDRAALLPYIADGDKFKFMPGSLEDAAVAGVALKEEQYPPLELPAQNDLHYFRVLRDASPRRWSQIQQEGAVTLVWDPGKELDLGDASFTLFMTLPTASNP